MFGRTDLLPDFWMMYLVEDGYCRSKAQFFLGSSTDPNEVAPWSGITEFRQGGYLQMR